MGTGQASAAAAVAGAAFRIEGEHVAADFIRRSDVLFVTFDNLATVGQYDPPRPWLHAWMEGAGFSVLGLIARRKDWYRNAETPRVLSDLRGSGLFDRFRRIVFCGASMGGYAALTYARLVPGAAVLVFSPQTTLDRRLVPFEGRFRYGQRKWDWTSDAFLDGADGIADAPEVWVFHDPFVPEDRAHARRLTGPAVRHVTCGHFGHRLMRQLKSCGVLDDIFRGIGEGRFDEPAFRRALRCRRDLRAWRKAFLANAEARHPALARRAVAIFAAEEPRARYLRKATARLDNAPVTEIRVRDGDPQSPFSGLILTAQGAIAVPERDGDAPLACGVLLADRSYCELSRGWIRAGRSTPPPRLAAGEKVAKLPGRHLFAGHMRGHFGHFLVESTARLWALPHLGDQLDGVIYLPYRGEVRETERAIAGMDPFFRRLGLAVPIRTVGAATEVEELHIPELGFGWRERYAGSPAYRRFMRERLGQGIAPEGGEKLYISRARLPSQRGGVLGETVIEENLARAGFEVFHPERHPLEVQIARYKAAKEIVALDGSALHLAAFFLRPGGRVAIVLRRSKANAGDYRLQYRSFCGVDPDVIDVIARDWVSENARRVDFRSVGELDFAALFARLGALGYLAPGFVARLPAEAEIAAMRDAFAERRREAFRART
jgi:hypothetical protein